MFHSLRFGIEGRWPIYFAVNVDPLIEREREKLIKNSPTTPNIKLLFCRFSIQFNWTWIFQSESCICFFVIISFWWQKLLLNKSIHLQFLFLYKSVLSDSQSLIISNFLHGEYQWIAIDGRFITTTYGHYYYSFSLSLSQSQFSTCSQKIFQDNL